MSKLPIVILKFSGRSLNTINDWNNITAQIRLHLGKGHIPLVVCSALDKVTDRLEALIEVAQLGCDETNRQAVKAQIDSLRCQHYDLAQALTAGQVPTAWPSYFEALQRLLLGISLTGEATNRLKAQIMGLGEKLTASLGELYLKTQLTPTQVHLLEAPKLLKCPSPTSGLPEEHQYLEADLGPIEADNNLQRQICEICEKFRSEWPKLHTDSTRPPQTNANSATSCDDSASCPQTNQPNSNEIAALPVFITQGYLASNTKGELVLLGRGGSDVSAAALGVKLEAQEVEFWSDLPGFYTTDPRLIASARLLRRLDYSEAQELASAGSPVVHPKAIALLSQCSIPIYVRCSTKPDLEGTYIGNIHASEYLCVKALTVSGGLTLISMENIGMWQQVGFLAKAFAIFAKYGFSIDLAATSQSNVTVSLDPASGLANLEALLQELRSLCSPKVISPCAALSLVGQKIRSNLHKLGPTLELFEEEKVHLLSQAASDLNFTFVVDESQAERLLKTLHAQLFSGIPNPTLFGPSFRQEFLSSDNANITNIYENVWWVKKRRQLLDLATIGSEGSTPAYVYDRQSLIDNAQTLTNLRSVDHVFFAMKANSNRDILRIFYEQGLGFECVSRWEVERVRDLFPDLPTIRLLFTPNFADYQDYAQGFALGAMVTLDNIEPLKLWPDLFRGRQVLLRLDLGHGVGHSRKVRTAGNFSKFGITLDKLPAVKELTDKLSIEVIGLHSHSGSGIKTAGTWAESAMRLSEWVELFPSVKYLDLGGGLGVPERRDLDSLDLHALDEQLLTFKEHHPNLEIFIEPGRFLVAQAGVLLAKVCQTKQKGDKLFIGGDAGMQTLIRPALYGAYHEIVNLTRWGTPKTQLADIVGPICETGDILGRDRHITPTQAGDILLVDTAGAYGYTMSSDYNLRPKAKEILV